MHIDVYNKWIIRILKEFWPNYQLIPDDEPEYNEDDRDPMLGFALQRYMKCRGTNWST